MALTENILPNVAPKLLQAFLRAGIQSQLSGSPLEETLRSEAQKHYGQARRMLRKVAALGPDSELWMQHFIESLEKRNV